MTIGDGFVTSSRLGARPADERERLRRAVEAAPGDPAPHRALAAWLARTGEPRAALDQYRALLGLIPGDAAAAVEAGLLAIQCGREEDLLALVGAAAAANPDNARLWQVLGQMHRSAEDLEPAIAALDRAAQLAPRDPALAHGRAQARLEAGISAVDHYVEARRLAPGDRSMLLGLAAALAVERRAEEGAALLDEALRRDPNWVDGHVALARHRWALGDRDGFTASFAAALAVAPRNVDLWRELLIASIHAGDFEGALSAVERGRTAAGPHPVFSASEATCQAELGRHDQADALFASLAHLRDPTVLARQVRHLLRTGRPEEAERIALPMTRTAAAADFIPYLSIAWRMTGNPLWQWLEGDPRLVGVYDLAELMPSLDALAERLRAMHVSVAQPLDQSLRGGTQTEGLLFSRLEPEIKALRKAMAEAVRDHLAQLPPRDPGHPQLGPPRGRPIRFAGSWSVRLAAGGHHASHVHPEGWFSSAFYVALPDPDERGPEPAGWLTLGEPAPELQLPPIRLVEPKPGRLVLFPSTMWHGTRPFGAGERLTVAFDVAPPVGE